MESLDTISIGILLGALLVLAGILSSLIALRFGAPLLLFFLIIGMIAGEAGLRFHSVRIAYTVGAIALALILFDGGLRTRLQTFRNVLAPAGLLATFGVLVTAAVTAPIAKISLGLGWTESLLMGSVVASTDAAAVLFLVHARGLRLRPRVGGILEVESATNDPFAVFLAIVLVEILLHGDRPWSGIALMLGEQAVLGAILGFVGGRAMVLVLNRIELPQGLHAPFVTTAALVIFGIAAGIHASGFLAVYIAGLIVGNRPARAHGTLVVFLDAVTWLAQIAMFVLLGLLVWPGRLFSTAAAALAVAGWLMFVARPAAVFLCLAPFPIPLRDKIFISWVGLRGAVGIFLASIPLLVGMQEAHLYFDVAFVVVLVSLLVQGWTVAAAARLFDVAFSRPAPISHRIELDLPGQLAQELVGYSVEPQSPYLRRGIVPSWAKPTLVVRDERVLTAAEAGPVRHGDYLYVLAPPEKAQALDRFFVDMPPPASPDPRLLGDFFLNADAALGGLAEIYGLPVRQEDAAISLGEYFARELHRPARRDDTLRLGEILLIAHKASAGRVTQIGLQLAGPEVEEPRPEKPAPIRAAAKRVRGWIRSVIPAGQGERRNP
jgi:potassium/hydrogen antiporter